MRMRKEKGQGVGGEVKRRKKNERKRRKKGRTKTEKK